MQEGEKLLYIPKNGGLRDYIGNMLPEIGVEVQSTELEALLNQKKGSISAQNGLTIEIERGEDIPSLVWETTKIMGVPTYGLTGDDLFDEYVLEKDNDTNGIGLLNTYDWFDESAKYKRPALCMMAKVDEWEEMPIMSRVAINGKYSKFTRRYLSERAETKPVNFYEISEYAGGTEKTVRNGINDCCVDIVYGGGSAEENGLKILEEVRFTDIALIGPTPPRNIWQQEFERIYAKALNPTDSYTSRLLASQNEIVKKFGSESGEFIQALVTNSGLADEALDVIYSTMVALASRGKSWDYVEKQLVKRWKA